MRKVKNQIAIALFSALHEANLSDVNEDEPQANDLPAHCAGECHARLRDALICLGYEAQVEEYFSTGDRPDFCFYADGSEAHKYQ